MINTISAKILNIFLIYIYRTNICLQIKKKKNSRLLCENKEEYVYFDVDGEQNEYTCDSELEIIPNPDAREVLYISGPSGCGKSTLASKYIKKFVKIFPKSEIYLFSIKDADPVFDSIPQVQRLKIDERMIGNPVNILEICSPNTLLIFDDTDTIEKKLLEPIMSMIHQILEVGRSYRLYCIITSHLLNSNSRKFSRVILNEAHWVVFFKNCNERGNKYFLKEYCGFDDDQIEEVLNIDDTRAIILHRFYPNFVIAKKKIFCPKKIKKMKGHFSVQNVSK